MIPHRCVMMHSARIVRLAQSIFLDYWAGKPERDVRNKHNPSMIIEDRAGGNSDSYPMSGNCIAGCGFREQDDVFDGEGNWSSVGLQ